MTSTSASPAATTVPVVVRRGLRAVLVLGGLLAVAWLWGVLFGAGSARADEAGHGVHHAQAAEAAAAPAAPKVDLGAAVSSLTTPVTTPVTSAVRQVSAVVSPVVHAATAPVAQAAPVHRCRHHAAAADHSGARPAHPPVATGPSTDRRSTPVTATGAAGGHAPDMAAGAAPTRFPTGPTTPGVPTPPAPASAPAAGAGVANGGHGPLGAVSTVRPPVAVPTLSLVTRSGDDRVADLLLTDLAHRPD